MKKMTTAAKGRLLAAAKKDKYATKTELDKKTQLLKEAWARQDDLEALLATARNDNTQMRLAVRRMKLKINQRDQVLKCQIAELQEARAARKTAEQKIDKMQQLMTEIGLKSLS